jgi:hypothetical protein
MHAVLLDPNAIRREPMHAVLHEHDATAIRQVSLTGIHDAAPAATVDDRLTTSATVSAMSLWCRLTGYAATATTVHVQPDGYGDPACVQPAAL